MGGALPKLVNWRKQDEIIPYSHAQNMPGAKVLIFDDAGHMIFMEQASYVNVLIKHYIGSWGFRRHAPKRSSWPGLNRPSPLAVLWE